jgi:hypothetical protein
MVAREDTKEKGNNKWEFISLHIMQAMIMPVKGTTKTSD